MDSVLDELVENHDKVLEKKVSDLFFKKEKLKAKVKGRNRKEMRRSFRLTKLISVYSIMIIVFTFLSFVIINSFYTKDLNKSNQTINLSIFKKPPGTILITNNELGR